MSAPLSSTGNSFPVRGTRSSQAEVGHTAVTDLADPMAAGLPPGGAVCSHFVFIVGEGGGGGLGPAAACRLTR